MSTISVNIPESTDLIFKQNPDGSYTGTRVKTGSYTLTINIPDNYYMSENSIDRGWGSFVNNLREVLVNLIEKSNISNYSPSEFDMLSHGCILFEINDYKYCLSFLANLPPINQYVEGFKQVDNFDTTNSSLEKAIISLEEIFTYTVENKSIKFTFGYLEPINDTKDTHWRINQLSEQFTINFHAPSSWIPDFNFNIKEVLKAVNTTDRPNDALTPQDFVPFSTFSGVELSVDDISFSHEAILSTKQTSQIVFEDATSTIKVDNYDISIDGPSIPHYGGTKLTKVPISGSGDLIATATIFDSRGRSTTKQLTIPVQRMPNPSFAKTPTIERYKDGKFNEDGENIHIEINTSVRNYKYVDLASYPSGNGGVTENYVKKISYFIKPYGNDSWITLDDSSFEYTFEDNISSWSHVINNYAFDSQTQYEVRVVVMDAFGGSVEYTKQITKSYLTIDLKAGGHGIAFGKASEKENTFECDMEADFNKTVNIDDNLWVGQDVKTFKEFHKRWGGVNYRVAPSSDIYTTVMATKDDNDVTGSYFEAYYLKSGHVGISLYLHNKTESDGDVWGGIQMALSRTGVTTYDVSAPANFRAAIDAPSIIHKNNYWGIGDPWGGDGDYIRAPFNGIIPYQEGVCGSCGTQAWPWQDVWSREIHGSEFYHDGHFMSDSIVDSGSSGAWNYIKFKNGLAICELRDGFSTSTTQTWRNMYYDPNLKGGYPYPFHFAYKPAAFMSIESGSGRYWPVLANVSDYLNYTPTYFVASANSYYSEACELNLFVFGRYI